MFLLELRGLSKSYGGKSVVKDLDLRVEREEIVGLLGPNGAGKTTTFYMVVGIVRPDHGKIILDNRDITRLPIHARARRGIGYLSQEQSVFRSLTVRQNILAILEITQPFKRREREARVASLLHELKIAHLADTKAYNLSGGERRRLEITRALAVDPSLILLDEPFSGIEPIIVEEIQGIIRQLKRRGMGVMLTDHNVKETLSITDRSYLIADGRIISAGNGDELLSSPAARERYLGPRFSL